MYKEAYKKIDEIELYPDKTIENDELINA